VNEAAQEKARNIAARIWEILDDHEWNETGRCICLTLDFIVWYLRIFPSDASPNPLNNFNCIPHYRFQERINVLEALAEIGDVLNS
jgi:hypothetical protein